MSELARRDGKAPAKKSPATAVVKKAAVNKAAVKKAGVKKAAVKKAPAKKAAAKRAVAKKAPAKKAAAKRAVAKKAPAKKVAAKKAPAKKAAKKSASTSNTRRDTGRASFQNSTSQGPTMALPAPPSDPLAVLGLAQAFSAAQLRRAWRQYAGRHHPDQGGDAATFSRGRMAYESLLRDLGLGA